MSAADDEEAAKLKFENWSPCVVRIAILSSTLGQPIKLSFPEKRELKIC